MLRMFVWVTAFSRHSFGKVVSVDSRGFKLRNSNGFEWYITAEILEQEFTFANQHSAEEKVNRTELIQRLSGCPRMSITVNFNKKVKHLDVAKALKDGQGDLSDRKWSLKVRDLVRGEERTLTGHHLGTFDEHKRLYFIDQTVGFRLVDVRTVNWAIIDNVKYIVK